MTIIFIYSKLSLSSLCKGVTGDINNAGHYKYKILGNNVHSLLMHTTPHYNTQVGLYTTRRQSPVHRYLQQPNSREEPPSYPMFSDLPAITSIQI